MTYLHDMIHMAHVHVGPIVYYYHHEVATGAA
jgi:hypothetical protein